MNESWIMMFVQRDFRFQHKNQISPMAQQTLVIQYYGYLLWNFCCCHCCCCLVLCQLIWFQFRINYYFEIENAIECSQTMKRIWFFFSTESKSPRSYTHTQQFHKRFWIEAGGTLFVIQSMTSMRLIYI